MEAGADRGGAAVAAADGGEGGCVVEQGCAANYGGRGCGSALCSLVYLLFQIFHIRQKQLASAPEVS